MLDFSVHGGTGTQRRADVDFHEPGFQVAVDEDVEAVELEPAGAFVLGF